jgi:hypothetical protein
MQQVSMVMVSCCSTEESVSSFKVNLCAEQTWLPVGISLDTPCILSKPLSNNSVQQHVNSIQSTWTARYIRVFNGSFRFQVLHLSVACNGQPAISSLRDKEFLCRLFAGLFYDVVYRVLHPCLECFCTSFLFHCLSLDLFHVMFGN